MTKRRIDTLKPGETVWDTDPRGFCCRCQTRRKIFQLRFRSRGRQRWLTIGEVGAPWTVETARREAQRLLGEIRSGVDVEVLRYGGNATDPTIADLCDRFIEEHARHHKRASSMLTDEKNIANHVKPLIGHLAVKDVTRSDIESFKQAIRDGKTATKRKPNEKRERFAPAVLGGPGVANRCLALLSKMYNLAEIWGWRAENSNPVRLVAKYPENPRQRFLSDEELQRLGQVLEACDADGSESPYVTAAIRLLLLTGARLSEILTLKWDYIDQPRGLIQLPSSKTGQKIIFLNDTAIAVLNSIERQPSNPYVISGAITGRHLVNIQKPWRRIRKLVDLEDVRIHDLRHSFAAIAAGNGASLPLIGQLLGHTQPQTTKRYAHLAAKPVRDVNDKVGATLENLLGPQRNNSR